MTDAPEGYLNWKDYAADLMNENNNLHADNERLRTALHTIAEVCPKDDCRHVARRALEPKP
jgi:regulator of replication initiation timing